MRTNGRLRSFMLNLNIVNITLKTKIEKSHTQSCFQTIAKKFRVMQQEAPKVNVGREEINLLYGLFNIFTKVIAE